MLPSVPVLGFPANYVLGVGIRFGFWCSVLIVPSGLALKYGRRWFLPGRLFTAWLSSFFPFLSVGCVLRDALVACYRAYACEFAH